MASSDARSDGAAPDAVAATLQKQLEYYFSDANLRRDAHLRGLAGADDDASLRQFVDLEHVLAFARARAILNESTTDGEPATKRAKTEIPAVALEAVRASSALELSEDGTKIRRAQPYIAVDAKELAARTVYVEPVADDASIDSIQARFAPHGAVANVSLPRGRGFGFVEFEARESAQKAVAALDGVEGVAVLTKGEWERIDRRWKDLSRSPAVAQARRRRRNMAEAAAPKLGGSKIRPGSFAGKGGKK
jgi:hypothetical protein